MMYCHLKRCPKGKKEVYASMNIFMEKELALSSGLSLWRHVSTAFSVPHHTEHVIYFQQFKWKVVRSDRLVHFRVVFASEI